MEVVIIAKQFNDSEFKQGFHWRRRRGCKTKVPINTHSILPFKNGKFDYSYKLNLQFERTPFCLVDICITLCRKL